MQRTGVQRLPFGGATKSVSPSSPRNRSAFRIRSRSIGWALGQNLDRDRSIWDVNDSRRCLPVNRQPGAAKSAKASASLIAICFATLALQLHFKAAEGGSQRC